jgi:L-iditol 2-dehydrogenase
MKALVLEQYNHLVYQDVPDPEISDNDVLIQVKACGICGSDVHGMDGSTGRRIPPLIMGHEAAGVIVETGSGVTAWETGNRVTFDSTVYPLNDWYTLEGHYNLSDNREVLGVSPGTYRRNGAFAEFVAVPQHILYRIPDNVSFEQAAMVEPFAIALHAVNLSRLKLGESSVVVGVGTIGGCVVQLLTLAGASTIAAIDLNQANLARASAMGANPVFHPADDKLPESLRSLTHGRGADLAFEAVGSSASINLGISLLRKGGRIILIGNISPRVEIPLQQVVTGELQLLGSCAIRGEYAAVLTLMSQEKIRTDPFISAVAPLADGAGWFNRLRENKEGLQKIILIP